MASKYDSLIIDHNFKQAMQILAYTSKKNIYILKKNEYEK